MQVSAWRKVLGAAAITTIPGLRYRLAMAPDTEASGQTAVRAEIRAEIASRSTNLPMDLGPLVGGEDDLAALHRMLVAHRQVAAFGRLDQWRARDALVGLVERSLVQVVGLEPPRYRLPATTRLDTRERLAAAVETDAMQRPHKQAMASLAKVARRQRLQLPSATWLEKAPDWLGRRIAVRLIHAGWVAHCRGEGRRDRDSIRAALALCEQEGEPALANAVRVLLASATLETGDAEAAIAHARSAIDALRPSNQSDHLGHALSLLCRGLLVEGDVAGAGAAACEALTLTHRDDADHPHLMRSVAALAASAGKPAAAARLMGHAQGTVPADEPAAECEERLDAQVWQTIVATLGSADTQRLRSAGASLDEDAACRLVRNCLAGGAAPPPDVCG